MRLRSLFAALGQRANVWILGTLLCLLATGGVAQEGENKPEQPQNVEQSIEALFGPDEKSEETTAEEEAKKSDEPVLYIADTDNGRIVVMQGLDGSGFTSVGLPGFGYGRFLRPAQVWVDYEGRLYVADSGNDRIVRMDQKAAEAWTELDGFSSPMGVAVDKNGVYVADTKNDRIVLVNEIKEGAEVKETITHRQLTRPTNLWIDDEGALYACCGEDPPGGKIFKTWVEKDRRRFRIFEGEGLSGSRFKPSGVITAGQNLRLLDESGQRVVTMRDMSGQRLKEFSFRDDRRYRLNRPGGLAVDSSGKRFFIADSGNDRVLEVRADGSIVQEFYQMNGDPTSALRNPTSIFVFSPAPAPEPEGDKEGKKEE